MRKPTKDQLVPLFLVIVAVASGADIWADIREGVNTFHLVQESILLGLTIVAFLWVGYGLIDKSRELKALKQTLDEINNLPPPDSEQAIQSKKMMSETIQTQFTEWGLSKSEQEVGLLLLKGFSLKEISTLRGTAEKTIRQQASAIYKKSGLSGRHVFSAWFFEDFMCS